MREASSWDSNLLLLAIFNIGINELITSSSLRRPVAGMGQPSKKELKVLFSLSVICIYDLSSA